MALELWYYMAQKNTGIQEGHAAFMPISEQGGRQPGLFAEGCSGASLDSPGTVLFTFLHFPSSFFFCAMTVCGPSLGARWSLLLSSTAHLRYK